MYATLTCNPPLGQTTVVPAQKQNLWTKNNTKSGLHRKWFTLDLTGLPDHGGSVSFTITFRAAEDEPWKWANEQFSTSDGHIIYQTARTLDNDLTKLIDGLPKNLKIQEERSDTPGTLLWSINSPVDAASGKASGFSNNKLGKPTNFSRWFALVRLWSPWLAPRQGKAKFNPDKEAIIAGFQREDGSHLVVLAVSGIDDVLTTLGHDGNGNITIDSRNDSEQVGSTTLIVAVGHSLETALSAPMYHARKLVMKYQAVSGETAKEEEALMKDYKPQWLQNWYDGLSYCTWNGIGQKLTEDKLFKALESLQKNNVNISNLIIDDNWQSLNHEGGDQFENAMTEFEATKIGFPRGLKATISDVREKHPNIKHIAVWHAIFGYWGGIAAKGKIADEYRTVTVRKKDGVSGGTMTAIAEEDVGRFYHDFYQFLSSAGVDSVKTDAQFFVDELDDATDRRQLIKAYQDAWSINQLRFFSGKAISCMSQTPQIIFHSQLPSNKPRILLRNSDDFFPEVPASHPWHIFCNAHNAIFNQYLNILPDWDMFQTSHEWASFHAAARCVSGGPIYITDVPGKHDIDLIDQMVGNTPRGDTVILRPHTVGKSTSAYNSYDDTVLLRVSTFVGMAHSGVSILGVFNCTQHPLTELMGLDQFPGAETGTYIIRSHTSGNVSKPTSADSGEAFVHLEVPVVGWEILSAFPLQSFKLERGRHGAAGPAEISVAHLGLLGKMTGAAGIINSDAYVERDSGKLRVWTSLKVLGKYGIYISDLKKRSIKDDFMAVIFGRPISSECVKINDQCENILEIDTIRAWKETDQHAGWSNEVAVEVIIR
ncbi:hypothetical protein SLS60_001208 [Paraconiothyrium brasiliense]|uniref:Alpha-galactosidase n=1 Tax=Paraconiothyrium brasiliense TaxID=300254 RepID=A0ABR3S8G0_9PLEO